MGAGITASLWMSCAKSALSKADVIEAARPYLIAALYQTLKRPVVVITALPKIPQIIPEN